MVTDVGQTTLVHALASMACADDVSPSASDKPTFRFGKKRGNKNAEIWD